MKLSRRDRVDVREYLRSRDVRLARSVPAEATRILERGGTVTEATLAFQRSSLSSRTSVLREANRRGRWFAVVSRVSVGHPFGRAEARSLAAVSADGKDVYQHCAVPERWRPLFVRTFVKATVQAAHTDRTVTVSSKYGV